MPEARHVSPKAGDVVLLVGTMKGAFLFRSDAARKQWQRAGPYFPGHAVYAMALAPRNGRPRLWAAPDSMHWGAVLRSSDDFGRTWSSDEAANVLFPEGTGASLKRIWQIAPATAGSSEVLYCGVEPAALFESKDGGRTFSLVRGLWDHPHRAKWRRQGSTEQSRKAALRCRARGRAAGNGADRRAAWRDFRTRRRQARRA